VSIFCGNGRMTGGWVYIMTNRPHGTLYVGATADIRGRAWAHHEGIDEGFTRRYGLKRLVHAQLHDDILDAIHVKSRSSTGPARGRSI